MADDMKSTLEFILSQLQFSARQIDIISKIREAPELKIKKITNRRNPVSAYLQPLIEVFCSLPKESYSKDKINGIFEKNCLSPLIKEDIFEHSIPEDSGRSYFWVVLDATQDKGEARYLHVYISPDKEQ